MDGQEIEQKSSNRVKHFQMNVKRTEKAKKNQNKSFNQVFFLKNIESIAGDLSFGKSCEGKNYASTFIWDVSSIFFLFLNVLGVIT